MFYCEILEGGIFPTKATQKSAGYDIYTPIDFILFSNSSQIIETGIKLQFPDGWHGELKCKSGLAFKHNITIFEGTIDNDYVGEIKIKITNNSNIDYVFCKGEKICQIILRKDFEGELLLTNKVNNTERGENGFGSSGK